MKDSPNIKTLEYTKSLLEKNILSLKRRIEYLDGLIVKAKKEERSNPASP